jgi:hypothetical protein
MVTVLAVWEIAHSDPQIPTKTPARPRALDASPTITHRPAKLGLVCAWSNTVPNTKSEQSMVLRIERLLPFSHSVVSSA